MPTLQFKGKSVVQNHHLNVKYHELIPLPEKSLTDSVRLNDNLIIHGDNLIALKALLPTYAGKVKCIYLDPPYNKGSENWAYNDNVNSPMIREWLGKVVDREDLTRHDKWLSMMTPRLNVLRQLLSDEGTIFISCDDSEQHHLRMLMDEIFGEKSFIANLIWKSRENVDSRTKNGVSRDHEYIVVYSLQSNGKLRGGNKDMNKYANPDDDPRGPWMSDNMVGLATQEQRPNLHYDITHPQTGIIYSCPAMGWRYERKRMSELIANNEVIFPSKPEGRPRRKKFLNDLLSEFTGFSSLLSASYTSSGTRELREIFGGDEVFDFPKPSELIMQLINQATGTNDESIILDSFAGSGTTAHAVLALNQQDGGHRRFILVEMEDYADTITAERVRRVIHGVPDAKNETLREGLPGTFSYFELGQPLDIDQMLTGDYLPPYRELARYVFYTATGEEFHPEAVDEDRFFIGESAGYLVYLLYRPDRDFLKTTALNRAFADGLGPWTGKTRLVFAPMKYLDDPFCHAAHIAYAQLPYELYRTRR
ncbi:MAG: site-specific DNA-methyltransferase [Firmicutes bacterium]|nr:site-specific DNA-methyltransferase [Bacillota bacterium]